MPSARVAERLKRDELRLIEALAAGDESEGVIGIEARTRLQRFPSFVYWNALAILGIRRFPGSQQQYHRAIDSIHRRRSEAVGSGEGEDTAAAITWHPRLPDPPSGLLERVTFELRREDADYLQERIFESSPGTFLAHLVAGEGDQLDSKFPWECSAAETAPAEVRDHLEHARNFSQLLHGAMLLYNLILAEKVNEARRAGADAVVDTDLTSDYRSRLEDWATTVHARRDAGPARRPGCSRARPACFRQTGKSGRSHLYPTRSARMGLRARRVRFRTARTIRACSGAAAGGRDEP